MPPAKKPRSQQEVAAIAMDDDYHGKTKLIQEETLRRSMAVAAKQMETMQLPAGDGAWVIVDLGCADGHNTVPLFKQVVEKSRARDARPVTLVFEDQPCNDFRRVHSIEGASFGPNVFCITANTGFFQPTMPPGSVHLSYSSHSMHYLAGSAPCNFASTGLKDTDAVGHEKAAFAAKAKQDWEKLLIARAVELSVGGRSVLSNLCVDEQGWYYGSTDRGQSLYTVLSDCARSMVADGKLTALEFEWATSPEYYRTVQEHLDPFNQPDSDVCRANLILKSHEVQVSRCPLAAAYARGEYEDAAAFAKHFAWCATSFSFHKLMRAFAHDGNRRPEAERRALVEEIYRRFEKRIEASPEEFGIDTVCLVMVMEKVPAGGSSQSG